MSAAETRKHYLERSIPLNVPKIDELPFITLISEAAEHQGIELRCCNWLPLQRPGRINRYGFTFYGNDALPVVLVSETACSDIQLFRNTLLQEVVHAFSQFVAENDEPPEDGDSAEYALGEIRAISGATAIGMKSGVLTKASIALNVKVAISWEVFLSSLGVSEDKIKASREQGIGRAEIIMMSLRTET
jgi:hypothetical protein